MVPDLLPRVFEDVADFFEIALAGIDLAYWAYTHVYSGGSAGFDA